MSKAAARLPLSISLINSLALISLINQWFGLVNGLRLSRRYKTWSKECKETKSGEADSNIKLLHMALNRNWLTTLDKVTKWPKAKDFCFSYISTSSKMVSKWVVQSANKIIIWNSGDVAIRKKINFSTKKYLKLPLDVVFVT